MAGRANRSVSASAPPRSATRMLRGIDQRNVIPTPVTQNSIETQDDKGSACQRTTRASKHGRSSATYDQYNTKYHPMDEYTRPKRAAKRRSGSRASSVLVDSDVEESWCAKGSSPSLTSDCESRDSADIDATERRHPSSRLPDPRATRKSLERPAKKPVNYSAKHHPQDSALPFRTQRRRLSQSLGTNEQRQGLSSRKRKRRHKSPASSIGEELISPRSATPRKKVKAPNPRSGGKKGRSEKAQQNPSSDEPEDLAEEALRMIGVLTVPNEEVTKGAIAESAQIVSSDDPFSSDSSQDPKDDGKPITDDRDASPSDEDMDDELLNNLGMSAPSTPCTPIGFLNDDTGSMVAPPDQSVRDALQVMDEVIMEEFGLCGVSHQPLTDVDKLAASPHNNRFSGSFDDPSSDSLNVRKTENQASTFTNEVIIPEDEPFGQESGLPSDSPLDRATAQPGHQSLSKTVVADSEPDVSTGDNEPSSGQRSNRSDPASRISPETFPGGVPVSDRERSDGDPILTSTDLATSESAVPSDPIDAARPEIFASEDRAPGNSYSALTSQACGGEDPSPISNFDGAGSLLHDIRRAVQANHGLGGTQIRTSRYMQSSHAGMNRNAGGRRGHERPDCFGEVGPDTLLRYMDDPT